MQYVGNGPEEGWGERERGKGTIGALPPFADPRTLPEGYTPAVRAKNIAKRITSIA